MPEGQWVVKFSKDGYEDADSYHDDAADAEGYLPVPPIQTEVNTAIISKAAPVVKSVSAAPNEVRIEFSQYMQPDTVNPVGIRILFLIPTRICFNCVFSSQLKIKLSVLFR